MAKVLTQFSPYNYNLNNPVNMLDEDGNLPTPFFVISYYNGKPTFASLSNLGAGFVAGATGISRAQLMQVRWINHTWNQGRATFPFSAKSQNAMTLSNDKVVYDGNLENASVTYWASLAGHKSTHTLQYSNYGTIPFF